ncbi:MAG: hypothetical protein ACI9LD_002139, partial [Polaromonas sp.]
MAHGLPLALWVANVMCDKPTRRAASMAKMTDWWLAVASSLMISTL